jgi:hypothetical protein
MALYPTIPLQGRGPKIETPAEIDTRLATLANITQQHALGEQQQRLNQQRMQANTQALDQQQMQMTEQQAAAERAAKVRDILSQEPDPDKAIEQVRAIDPDAAVKIGEHIAKRRTAQLGEQKTQTDLEKSELGLLTERRGLIANALGAVLTAPPEQRAAIYAAQRNALIATGKFKPGDIDEQMPDEATLRAFALSRLTPDQQAAFQQKEAAEGRAVELHEATLPGKTADPTTGLTPAQAATIANQGATQAETRRYHDATLAQGDQRIRQGAQRLANMGAGGGTAAQAAAQKQLGDLRKEELGLEAEEAKLAERRSEIGVITKNGKIIRDGKAHDLTAQEREKLDAEYAAADRRYRQVMERKRQITEQRAGIKSTAATSPAAAAAPTTSSTRQRAKNAQGQVIEWDGRNWVDPKTGKPVQ